MKKRMLAVLLTIVMMLSLPVAALAAEGRVEVTDSEKGTVEVALEGIDTSVEPSTFTITDSDYMGNPVERKVPIYPATGSAKALVVDGLWIFSVTKMVQLESKNWSFDGPELPVSGQLKQTKILPPEQTEHEPSPDGSDNSSLIGTPVETIYDLNALPEDFDPYDNNEYMAGCTVVMDEPGLYYVFGSLGPVVGCSEAFVRVSEAGAEAPATPAAPSTAGPQPLPAGSLSGYVPVDWARSEVNAARDSGLIPVFWYSQYDCGKNVTRQEFCELATRLYCVNGPFIWEMIAPLEDSPFQDASSMEINQMYKLGVVDGVGGGNFNPQGELTREQAAKVLTLLYNVLEPGVFDESKDYWAGQTLADAPAVSAWAQNYVDFVLEKGIMNGVGKGKFDPQGKYTIAQAALTMYRLGGRTDMPLMATSDALSIHDLGLERTIYSASVSYRILDGSNVASLECTALKLNGQAVEFTVDTAHGDLIVNFDLFPLGDDYGNVDMKLTRYELSLTITMEDGSKAELTDTFQHINGNFGGYGAADPQTAIHG